MLIPIKIYNKSPFQGTNGKGYRVKAKAKEAEIFIYEEIGDSWFGGVTAEQFAKDLKALGDVKKITVRINSPGGYVNDGVAIYNLLKQHKAEIITTIDSQAASIASVVFMAGDKRLIAENGTLMIHRAWGISVGNAAEFRGYARILETFDEQIIKAYLGRVNIDEETLKDLLVGTQTEDEIIDGTWMNAETALEYGFATEIIEDMEVEAKWDNKKFAYLKQNPFNKDEPEAMSTRQKLASMRMASQKLKGRLNQ